MKANFLDFRKKMKDILKAMELNEPVEVFYRGKSKGILSSNDYSKGMSKKASANPAFGIWKDNAATKNPSEYVRDMRKSRYDI